MCNVITGNYNCYSLLIFYFICIFFYNIYIITYISNYEMSDTYPIELCANRYNIFYNPYPKYKLTYIAAIVV